VCVCAVRRQFATQCVHEHGSIAYHLACNECRIIQAEKLMYHPTWVDLKGLDSVPDTVHHCIVPVDPQAGASRHENYVMAHPGLSHLFPSHVAHAASYGQAKVSCCSRLCTVLLLPTCCCFRMLQGALLFPAVLRPVWLKSWKFGCCSCGLV
jgi:hypothetical protein